MRILTFIKRLGGLKEPALESEFYEEMLQIAERVEKIIIASDSIDLDDYDRNKIGIYNCRTIKIKKLYGISKIIAYVWAVIRNRNSIDLVYVRTFSPPESIALWCARRIFRIRSVLLIPGTWLFEPSTLKNRLFRWIFCRAVYAADRIVLYSPLMIDNIRRYFPRFDERRVRYVHNGVNVRRFRPDLAGCSYVNVGGDMLLFVGRISRRKGVVELVNAFNIIAREYGSAVLVLAGAGDEEYESRLKRLVKELKLEGRVVFLGPVPNSDVPSLMVSSYVFVYYTLGGEGIPRAILEAMACGVPVVATRVAGIPEAVRDGETGYVVDVGDTELFARRVLELLRDRELRNRMGKAARELVEREFSYDVVIPKLVDVMRECVES